MLENVSEFGNMKGKKVPKISSRVTVVWPTRSTIKIRIEKWIYRCSYGYVDENQEKYNDTEKSNNADAEAMTDAANQAKDAADNLEKAANTYNEEVTKDQNIIDAEVKTVDGTLTVTVTDENNQEQTKNLDAYVEEKKNAWNFEKFLNFQPWLVFWVNS